MVWGTPYESDSALGPVEHADPFATDDEPGAKTRPEPNDVTAAMFLLIRTQSLPTKTFTCPATRRDGWDLGRRPARQWTNWRGVAALRDHVGYSVQNPYPAATDPASGRRRWAGRVGQRQTDVIAADMNPGADDLLRMTVDSAAAEQAKGNSLNHGAVGQNALFGDGHVEFVTTPFCGPDFDNVYTYGPSGGWAPATGGDGIVGPPADEGDVVLLPTAKALGQSPPDAVDPAAVPGTTALFPPGVETEEQLALLRGRLVGRFERQEPQTGRPSRLEVTADRLTVTNGPAIYSIDYVIERAHGQRVTLRPTTPDVPPTGLIADVRPSGVTFTGVPAFAGQWERRP